MIAMGSQITSLMIIYSKVYSGPKKTSKLRVTDLVEFTDDRWMHKGPITRKMFPFDDVIMQGRDQYAGTRQRSAKSASGLGHNT